MPTTIGVTLVLSSGKTNLSLQLFASGVLLNTGGDALVEVGTSGFFQASVDEVITATLDAIVLEGAVAVYGGTLYLGQTQVDRVAPAPSAITNANALLNIQVLAGVSYLDHFTSLATLAIIGEPNSDSLVDDIMAVRDGLAMEATLEAMQGTSFDTATDSLEAIRAAVNAGGTVNVLPAVGIVADRSPGATISPVVGETISQSITLYATDGTTPINLSGKTLAIVFETLQGADVAVVPNANIAISGDNNNVVTFAYPSAVTLSERTLMFAIRDAGAPLTMYLQGLCIVTRAPQVD